MAWVLQGLASDSAVSLMGTPAWSGAIMKVILRQVHTPKVGFYIVNFFLLFLNKSQKDPTFGFYNLAHSDVTVSHSF